MGGARVSFRIGIDVGGTNTDAVLIAGGNVRAWAKHATTEDVTSGIMSALNEVLPEADHDAIEAIMIGTTHFTNAVVQRKELAPIAVIRLGAPATESVPPLVDWPVDLAGMVLGHYEILPGGHEFDGGELSALDPAALRAAARDISRKGLRSVAVSAVFSPINFESEDAAASILAAEFPDAEITLSHDVGRLGLIERENATALNAALLPLGRRIIAAFERAVSERGLNARVYLTQNDGTLMNARYAARYPVLTFASGPSNSMRGAAYLSGISDGFVIDIGGTTTDVGALVRGFPRPAGLGVDIGGVRTNFRMPDVLSIGLGGGSIVSRDPVRVGPHSVGFRITEHALVFGGDTITATDVAVAAGRGAVGDADKVGEIDAELCRSALHEIDHTLDAAVDRMRTRADRLPVVLVGGGAFLAGEITSAGEIVSPPHAAVANAVGAAIAQVSGEVDRVVDLERQTREEALLGCRAEAVRQAELAGARAGSATIVDEEEIPLAYLPSNASRVRMKAVGDASV
jgi:N-methylhydantoinase A/oxoprolinase/acetone carboxylase beta subunit